MRKEWLQPFLKYITKVYNLKQKIKGLDDPRKQADIPISSVFFTLLLGALFRMKSLNLLDGWVRIGKFRKWVPKGTRFPFMDTMRRVLKSWKISSLEKIHQSIVQKARKNKVFQEGTIKGWTVAAMDGVELFESTKKSCNQCLTRVKKGVTHYFHKAVVCMSIGSKPYVIFGVEHLQPKKDGSSKNEGEQTGAKRLLKNLYHTYHHFADILVLDALYLNTPFLREVLSHGIHAVVRLKDERLHVMKDAQGLFSQRDADDAWKAYLGSKKVQITVWKDTHFYHADFEHPLSIYRFVETIEGTGRTSEMWVATTLGIDFDQEVIWEAMHKRWDLENSGFHELKTKWSLDHCFVHHPNAIQAMMMILIIVFNLFQLFLFRRTRNFESLGITQMLVIEMMNIEAENQRNPFHMLDPPKHRKRQWRKQRSVTHMIP